MYDVIVVGYQARRDAAALPMYEMTTELASFAPQRIGIADMAGGRNAGCSQPGDAALEAILCRGAGVVLVGEPVAQPRVERGGDDLDAVARSRGEPDDGVVEDVAFRGLVGDDEQLHRYSFAWLTQPSNRRAPGAVREIPERSLRGRGPGRQRA
jgi:hypothetical protein